MSVAAALLLLAVVAICLLCVLGLLAFDRTVDRLHYLTPATTVAPLLLLLAVALGGAGWEAILKTGLTALVLLVTGAALTHAFGRAAVLRERLVADPSGEPEWEIHR